jgi:hypothetical protein
VRVADLVAVHVKDQTSDPELPRSELDELGVSIDQARTIIGRSIEAAARL